MMLMLFHPNARAAKSDAFRFQAEPLLETIFAGQRDFAARRDYAMPRQSTAVAQSPDYLTCAPGNPAALAISP